MKKKLLAGLMAASLSISSLMWSPTVNAEIKPYEGVGEYIMSDYETPVVAKERARARALANAQKQASVYVERHLKMSNHKVDADVINVITKGIMNVVGKVKYKQTPIDEDGRSYRIIATVTVNIDSYDIDEWFDRGAQERGNLVGQNKALQRSNAEKDREIEELKRQIAGIRTEADQERLTAQIEATDKEFLSNQKVEEGDKLYYVGEFNEAIEIFNEAIELNPYNAMAYTHRGFTYNDLNRYEQAIADLNRAIELDPQFELAYNNRGIAYAKCEQYERAIYDFGKTIELNPKDATTYYNRGLVYILIQQFDRALADYDKALRLDPDFADAYNNRGAIYYKLGRYDRAVADYSKVIALDPNHAAAYSNRGEAYNALGQYNKALSDCNKAIIIDPNYAEAYYNRSVAYKALGNNAKAQSDFDKALALGYNP